MSEISDTELIERVTVLEDTTSPGMPVALRHVVVQRLIALARRGAAATGAGEDDEMVERVAKAIFEADPECGFDAEKPNTHWRNDTIEQPEVWKIWLKIARAAIAAINEGK